MDESIELGLSVGHNDLAIGWVDLNYFTTAFRPKNAKPILNGLCGSLEFGTLTALMGPSGAGKSTLLKCINGHQINDIEDKTRIYLNKKTAIKSAFIVQNVSQHLMSGLTALQTLVYASKLKNTGLECDHKQNARNVLKELMISDIEDRSVELCSGGEQKRLVIAMELTSIVKPNLLCIDEPTSGLDSNAAEIVVECLQRLTELHSISIVTSIHQPNSDIVLMFDKLYVLAKGGRCVFEGSPDDLEEHLACSKIPCSSRQVPIEVLIKCCSKDDGSVDRLIEENSQRRTELIKKCEAQGVLKNEGIPPIRTSLSVRHFWYLFERSAVVMFRSQWRNSVALFATYMSLALFVPFLYDRQMGKFDGCIDPSHNISRLSEHEEGLITQNIKFQYFNMLSLQFLMTLGTVMVFSNEVSIFFNENHNGWYSTGSYFWSKTLSELPVTVAVVVCFTFTIYRLSNQITDQDREWGYLLITTMSVLTAQGTGFAIGAICRTNDKLGIVLSCCLYLYNTVLSGFFSPIEALPSGVRWITHFSYVKQTSELLLYVLYGFDRCPDGKVSVVLRRQNINDYHKAFSLNGWILFGQMLGFRLIALFIMLYKANRIRIHRRMKKLTKF